MAWNHKYVNCEKLCNLNESEKDICILYELKIPPHGSIREEWTTLGMKHGPAKILFVEYRMEDDDIDGVWEAYGMKRDSEYSFTVNADKADPDKLFVYTLYKDGSMGTGFDVDTENARAILTFPQPQNITAEQLLAVTEKGEKVFRVQGAVEEIIVDELLGGSEDTMCLAYFNW